MLSQLSVALLATAVAAYPQLVDRSVAGDGGWSLSVGNGTCPAGSSTCFSDQTGNSITSNRLNECCPSGTTPRLDCGTYVNTGQPYACCPLDNPDCRGDVEKTVDSSVCANSGWALWYIPDGGYNSFCCLPGQYGYWYKSLGQDAVGQCSDSSILPADATPGTQVNNGDGTVSGSGVQIVPILPANVTCDGYGICKSTLAPAPTCDVIHYGWSLQTNTSTCTAGSNLCSYPGSSVGACCPVGLSCGTVIGDSEVPPCCPPGNPDCRGDVEGLWPQVCADSSWSLWHVNENGNHFCCKPGELGYNRIHDVYATGLCGTAVPRNTNTTTWMRSILDYVGDGSVAGSHLEFPCDSTPAPNSSVVSMVNAILNPPASLNPFPVTVTQIYYANATVSCFPTTTPVAIGDSPYKPGNPGNPTGEIIYTAAVASPTGSSGSGSSGSGSSGSGSSGSGSSGSGSSGSGSSGSGSSGSGSSGSGSSGSGSSGSGSSGSGSSGSGSSGSGSSGSGSSGSGSSGSGSSGSGSSGSGSSGSGSGSGSYTISTQTLYQTTVYETVCSTGVTQLTTSKAYSTKYVTISVPAPSATNKNSPAGSSSSSSSSGSAVIIGTGTAKNVTSTKTGATTLFTGAASVNTVGGILALAGFAAVLL